MTLKIDRNSPTTLTLSRYFAAPPDQVWRAHITPDLVQKWLTGPDGWSITNCQIDAKAGGSFRYDWREDSTGNGFYLTARIEEYEPPHRMVHVEVMYLPDPTPENRVETKFQAEGDGTRMTMIMQVEDGESMDAMLSAGMSDGMEDSYKELDAILL